MRVAGGLANLGVRTLRSPCCTPVVCGAIVTGRALSEAALPLVRGPVPLWAVLHLYLYILILLYGTVKIPGHASCTKSTVHGIIIYTCI